MANPEHVKVVRQGAAAIAEWRRQNPGVRLDLSGVDLSGADLNGADLAGSSLPMANLTEAGLTEADLSGADLLGAYLLLPRGQVHLREVGHEVAEAVHVHDVRDQTRACGYRP